jgi:sulfate adenylyltransferase
MIEPYGGSLVDLLVADEGERADLVRRAAAARRLALSSRALCDLELLAVGAFSPLRTFMGEADYRRCLSELRLADGRVFPIPVTLSVPDDMLCRRGDLLALCDAQGTAVAVIRVEEIYTRDATRDVQQICGTTDTCHPFVREMAGWPLRHVSGPLEVLQLPLRPLYRELCSTPSQVRARLAQIGRSHVVAFQTRNPMHRVHEELTRRAAAHVNGALLLHPVVGQTRPGDVDPYTRMICYTELVRRYYDSSRTVLSLLPLAMRMAGPREALWHAVIRRNYGATHMIVGRDHAGPGRNAHGRPFYGPCDSQALVRAYQSEIGVQPLAFDELVYVPDEDAYVERHRAGNRAVMAISGTQVRERYVSMGRPLPHWFTRPEVGAVLARSALHLGPGFCVWLTGLSGAGKSTIAEALAARLRPGARQITILDGDAVRARFGHDLGYTPADRNANVLRIASMADELTRAGHIVVCAVIAPYAAARARVRQLIGRDRVVLVYVATPLAVCEQRDVKGLYSRARSGEVRGLTGIDDPFEEPVDADVHTDGSSGAPHTSVDAIVTHLVARGLVPQRECPGPVGDRKARSPLSVQRSISR